MAKKSKEVLKEVLKEELKECKAELKDANTKLQSVTNTGSEEKKQIDKPEGTDVKIMLNRGQGRDTIRIVNAEDGKIIAISRIDTLPEKNDIYIWNSKTRGTNLPNEAEWKAKEKQIADENKKKAEAEQKKKQTEDAAKKKQEAEKALLLFFQL